MLKKTKLQIKKPAAGQPKIFGLPIAAGGTCMGAINRVLFANQELLLNKADILCIIGSIRNKSLVEITTQAEVKIAAWARIVNIGHISGVKYIVDLRPQL